MELLSTWASSCKDKVCTFVFSSFRYMMFELMCFAGIGMHAGYATAKKLNEATDRKRTVKLEVYVGRSAMKSSTWGNPLT